MNGINILLACLGGGVTLMVAIGMILLTPHGMEPIVETPLEEPRPREEARPRQEPRPREEPRPRQEPTVGREAEVAPPA